MVGPLLIALVAPARAGAAPDCPDVARQVEWAQEEVLLEVDAAAAREALDGAEEGLRCGPPQPGAVLARMFLVEAATATLEGDEGGAADAFAAAHRCDPDAWIEALGPRLRERYDQTVATEADPGTLDLQAGAWELWLDGRPATMPATVPAGLHVVQVHDGQRVVYGRVLWLMPGEEQRVDLGLPPRPAEAAEPPAVEPAPSSDPPVGLYLGGGVNAGLGAALEGRRADGVTLREPAAKLTLPAELGVVVDLGGVWLRPTVGAAPLLGGRFLWAGPDGATGSLAAFLGDLAVAAETGRVSVGGMAGLAYPGRIALRGLVALPLGEGPLWVEGRAGLHLATAGRVEPVAGLVLGARVP